EADRGAQVAGRGFSARAPVRRSGGQPSHRQAAPEFRVTAPLPRRRGADAATARRVLAYVQRAERRLRSARVARLLARVALFSVVTAAAVVVVAGVVTPGYDPMARTISRLAVPGSPAAFAVDLAIGLVAPACFALAAAIASAGAVGAVRPSSPGSGCSAAP